MSVGIPDPRFEEPELFDPNRKPVGNVVIDWDNSITRGLYSCLLFGSDSTSVDLVNRSLKLNNTSGWGTTIYYNTSENGIGIYCPTATSNHNTAITMPTVNTIPQSAWSVQSVFRPIAGNLNGYLFNLGGTGSDRIQWRQLSINRFALTMWNSGAATNVIFNSSYYPGYNSNVITTPNDGNYKYYGLDAETSVFSAAATRDNDLSNNKFDPCTALSGSASSIDGWLYAVHIWHRELSASEARSMRDNPYQFLIPA